jgi:DNA repair protein RecO (recombination protein O)
MLVKTKGIVLHTLKYGDSSLIVTLYTEQFGRLSCIINAARGNKAKNKSAVIQPLFLLELEIYLKKSRELQRIKELNLFRPYVTIPYDVAKSGQVLFLAELLYKIIREEETNPELFSFLEDTLVYLDSLKEGSVNFHVWFLAHLTRLAGIYPHLPEIRGGCFDMKRGTIASHVPLHPFYMDPETTICFKNIMLLEMNGLPELRIQHALRSALLSRILDYYHLHFESLGNFNSLLVLNEVFQGK